MTGMLRQGRSLRKLFMPAGSAFLARLCSFSRFAADQSFGDRSLSDNMSIVHITISYPTPRDQDFTSRIANYPRAHRNCHVGRDDRPLVEIFALAGYYGT